MRASLRTSLATLAIVALATTVAGAQGEPGPRAVADSFFRLVAAERFVEAARLTDLGAFDVYRRQVARDGETPPERVTAAVLRRHDPEMPRAVAEYQARRMNQVMRDHPSHVEHEFGYRSADSLLAAPVEAAAARWLATQDVRARMRAVFVARDPGCPAPTLQEVARFNAALRLRPARLIGVVMDDSVAYVLHDPADLDLSAHADTTLATTPAPTMHGGWHPTPPSVLVLRRRGEAWRITAPFDRAGLLGFSRDCQQLRPAPPRR